MHNKFFVFLYNCVNSSSCILQKAIAGFNEHRHHRLPFLEIHNGLFFAKVYIMITRQNCYLVECGILPDMKLFTIFNLLIVANVLIEDSIGAKNSSRMKKLLKNNGHNGK